MSQSDENPPLGFITVEVDIPRPPGDALNETTWPFPLFVEMAKGSQLDQIVTDKIYPPDFLDRFVEAGERLVARGCIGIITDCGFLAMAQPDLARRLPVPIAASALIQIPSILAMLPAERSIGVLSYDGSKLGSPHLSRLGIWELERIHIVGAPENGELKALVRDKAAYSHDRIQAEVVKCAMELVAAHPNIGAILLECTQMPPFAETVWQAVKLPVYDVFTLGTWFYSGLQRRKPQAWRQARG